MIEWILGGSSAIAVVGVVTLGIYIARQASNHRSDLREQVRLVSVLADERIAKAALERAMGDLNEVLDSVQSELARARDQSASLQKSLSEAFEEMAKSGTASGAVHALRGALDRLSKMSAVPTAIDAEGSEDTDRLHGPAAADDSETGLKDRYPGP